MTIIISLTHINSLNITRNIINYVKKIKICMELSYEAMNDPIIRFFSILIGTHSQTEASARSWPKPAWGEWYSFNYNICMQCNSRHYGIGCHIPMVLRRTVWLKTLWALLHYIISARNSSSIQISFHEIWVYDAFRTVFLYCNSPMGSIIWAVRRLTAKSHKISKPRDWIS